MPLRHAARCVASALLAASCGGPPGSVAGPGGPVLVRPATITSVEVLVLESLPVQVQARVRGELGDGCSEPLPVEQTRTGSEITLEVQYQRPRDAVCIQVVRELDELVVLEGPFPPGEYVLRANDLETRFRID